MNFSLRSSLASALALVLFTGCAAVATPPVSVSGDALVGPGGMTLYTFDKDVAGSGKSVCNGPCAVNWPPLIAASGVKSAGHYSVIMRDDGQAQWALKGKPLYYWVKDRQPGDKTGDGVNGVWHTAKP